MTEMTKPVGLKVGLRTDFPPPAGNVLGIWGIGDTFTVTGDGFGDSLKSSEAIDYKILRRLSDGMTVISTTFYKSNSCCIKSN